jgi:hypothetical protein
MKTQTTTTLPRPTLNTALTIIVCAAVKGQCDRLRSARMLLAAEQMNITGTFSFDPKR